ncbi:3-beta hydroxysteroid dehydrogenase [Pilimelia terevasa]|uniref:3-beta hydroxysteroid dehydrogenase n=1 Tax=Pilimelia terevasa TaxID=53372 RepID=A0A8J3BSE1_9ACTN|nr:NAD-dependent epimerase/dehydratase family protein [Pilimelia terevasa]GGK33953.1 3-beta hydroxysteroid dehydrogenase [Pilimelia terevasa]
MRVLVTGSAGFLGRAVCARLAGAGHEVRAMHRRPVADGRPPPDGQPVYGDVRRLADVERAVTGCAAVVHCAARAGHWGPAADFHDTNVGGTGNVIEACRRLSVARLVYTSSPSVVHGGADLPGVDESVGYPAAYAAAYPRTKAIAERMVLAANGTALPSGATLATVALRPHLIWGPGDPHFLPRLVRQARRNRLWLIGDAGWLVDTVYVDNAADAHVSAVRRLGPGAAIAGRPYFVTQDDPRPIGEILALWLAAAGLPAPTRRLPVALARVLAWGVETGYGLAGIRSEPPLTRFLVQQLTTAHWFDIGAARRDLGYRPAVGTEAGLEVLRAHLAARP